MIGLIPLRPGFSRVRFEPEHKQSRLPVIAKLANATAASEPREVGGLKSAVKNAWSACIGVRTRGAAPDRPSHADCREAQVRPQPLTSRPHPVQEKPDANAQDGDGDDKDKQHFGTMVSITAPVGSVFPRPDPSVGGSIKRDDPGPSC
jgi:hypothetical protein